jgi:hypothetical protein
MGEEDANGKSAVVFIAAVAAGKKEGKDQRKEEAHVQTVKLVLERDEDIRGQAGGGPTVGVDVDAAEAGETTEPLFTQEVKE